MSNGLDPDRARHDDGPDLDLDYLLMSSTNSVNF